MVTFKQQINKQKSDHSGKNSKLKGGYNIVIDKIRTFIPFHMDPKNFNRIFTADSIKAKRKLLKEKKNLSL